MKPTTTHETWCAVFTAWPKSTVQGRKPRTAEEMDSARAFTWSDQSAFGASLEASRPLLAFSADRSLS